MGGVRRIFLDVIALVEFLKVVCISYVFKLACTL